MTEHWEWPLMSIIVKSELGSKELTEVNGDYIADFVKVLGENSSGVKLGRGEQSYYILIPESHPMYNSNIILMGYSPRQEPHSASVTLATGFIRDKLRNLLVSLKQELGVK